MVWLARLTGALLDCLSCTHNVLAANHRSILYCGSMPVTRNKVQLVPFDAFAGVARSWSEDMNFRCIAVTAKVNERRRRRSLGIYISLD